MIIKNYLYSYFLLILNSLNIIKCNITNENTSLVTSDITNESTSLVTSDIDNFEYFTLPTFLLVKCHCEADSVWERGRCVLGEKTWVEFLLGFSPSVTTKKVPTSDFKNVLLRRPNCNSTMILPTIKNVVLTKQQTLFHIESGENFTQNFCIENTRDEEGNVILVAEVCIQSLQMPVCCPENQYLHLSTMQCKQQTFPKLFNPPVFIGSTLLNTTNLSPYFQHFPKCNPKYLAQRELNNDLGNSLQYQQSTVIFFHWDEHSVEFVFPEIKYPQDYCVAPEMQGSEMIYTVIVWEELSPLYCSNTSEALLEEATNNCDKIMNWLVLLLLSLSTVFLFIILGLHAAMPELRRSLGSKITICHVASLFCGFCILLFIQKVPPPFNCKLYGPLIQICFLATFFWLNVMCFDIWWKLRCRSPAGETAQSSRLQFMRYSFYAWGTPLMIGGVTVVMDSVPGLDKIDGVIVPGFGHKHCWFIDKRATLAYYFGIIAFLMAIDIFFFIWVFVILFKANCTYNKVLKNNQKSSGRTWIYLKIFGVMGISWFFEFLSWEEGTCKYWVITDVINALRGLMLFVIFFCNKKSMNKIKQRFSLMNRAIHERVNRSVISIRKLSHKSTTATVDTRLESRRTSETHSAEISHRTNPQENEDCL